VGGLTRRGFVGLSLAGGAGMLALRLAVPRWLRSGPIRPLASLSSSVQELVERALTGLDPERVVDLHVHVAGLGLGGSGCWVHPELTSHLHPLERLRFELYLGAAGVEADARADEAYVARLAAALEAGVPGLRLLLLAFDYHVRPDGSEDRDASMFHVPDEYVCALARTHPGFLACASVHPYRRDALVRLERARANGALAVKWLPSAMGIDPASPRCAEFYAKLVELDLPLLVHTGEERAVWVDGAQDLANPLRLRAPLRAGVQVVALHCASLGSALDLDAMVDGKAPERPAFELFQRLLAEPEHEQRLFGELSAVTLINRRADVLESLLSGAIPHARLLNGSDYPLIAVEPLTSLGLLVQRGFLAPEESGPLRELFRANPLLFDLVLKRRLRCSRDGAEHSFAPEVFESARLFAKL